MVSDKESIERLVLICEKKEISHVVFSPGSRNAPMVISFDENPSFQCLNIPDERVAAFFALGMAQQLNKPVIICCTSGSALLNYAPALVEAFYQKVPVLVLSADRPKEWIDQRAGQTMRQHNVFANYIKSSYELMAQSGDLDNILYNDRIINKAIEECSTGPKGPVHINIPLKEPLYEVRSSYSSHPKIIETLDFKRQLSIRAKEKLSNLWSGSGKVLILCGQGSYNEHLSRVLEEMASRPGVVILTEATSNISSEHVYSCIDRLIDSISPDEVAAFTPELLLTLGKSIVSKKIRQLLRKMDIGHHWHLDEDDRFIDTFHSLTMNIPVDPRAIIAGLNETPHITGDGDFSDRWMQKHKLTLDRHESFIRSCPWSDMKVFESLLASLPSGSMIHLANSTPVRYVQLFDKRQDIEYLSNRGVSGIDGCTSTAAGCAFVTDKIVTIVTGDIAFFYDSNAFWHHHLSKNLRVILINNKGGNIFRFIPGPSSTRQLSQHFEATHDTSGRWIAEMHGLRYFSAGSEAELDEVWPEFFSTDQEKVPILEINTPRELNDRVLRDYFEFLKTG